MLSLKLQPDQNETSSAEELFGHKLRTALPSIISSTQSAATEKHAVTQNQKGTLP